MGICAKEERTEESGGINDSIERDMKDSFSKRGKQGNVEAKEREKENTDTICFESEERERRLREVGMGPSGCCTKPRLS